MIIAESPEITEMNKLSLLESDAKRRNILTCARAGKGNVNLKGPGSASGVEAAIIGLLGGFDSL